MAEDESTATTFGRSHHDRGRIVRFVLVGLVAVVLIAVAVDNRHDTTVGYVVGDATVPVWIVMVIAVVVGVVFGWLIKLRSSRR
jgi:uncharacterized integral membrane protein